jgi:predicted RNase H-like HicB family nuclease
MLDLRNSLTIEATDDPSFFCFFSPDLEGFTGVGSSVEDCLYKAKWGMIEHVELLQEQGLPVPEASGDPRVIIQNAPQVSAA